MGLIKRENKTYASILSSDGKIRVQCNEGDEGAVKREYETSDGKTGIKFEHVYEGLSGKITGIEFKEGEYGKQIIVDIDGVSLALGTNTNFGEDFMKKLPNIVLADEVELNPYSFTNEKGKSIKGISIIQDGEKVLNFFYDTDSAQVINGYPPVPEGSKNFDSDDWKIYFMTARKFLIKYIEDNIITKMALEELPPMAGETVEDIAF